MTAVRGLLVLAILAALLGAPPTTSAAGNVLHTPVAEPATGTLATVFRLRVSYDGRFEATAVEAVVAGLPLPMRLVSGSALRGTWETSLSLTVGAWPVEFRAAALRGNQPSLAGPTLTVLGPSPSPPPSPVPTTIGGDDQPGGNGPQREEVDGQQQQQPALSTAPEPHPAEEPSASDPGDGSPSEPASGGSTGGPAADEDPKPDGGRVGQSEATSTPDPDPRRGDGEAAAGDDRTGDGRSRAVTDGGTGSGTEDAEDASPIVDDPALASVRVTAGWAAALLVLGFVLLGVLVWRRRHDGPGVEETDIAAATEAILRRRAVRRSRVVLPDDPIVRATLGSDEEDEPPATRPRR